MNQKNALNVAVTMSLKTVTIESNSCINGRGFQIKGLVCDGKVGLLGLFGNIPTQLCQFHQIQIVQRYLTQKPKMPTSVGLLCLAKSITSISNKPLSRNMVTGTPSGKMLLVLLMKKQHHRLARVYSQTFEKRLLQFEKEYPLAIHLPRTGKRWNAKLFKQVGRFVFTSKVMPKES